MSVRGNVASDLRAEVVTKRTTFFERRFLAHYECARINCGQGIQERLRVMDACQGMSPQGVSATLIDALHSGRRSEMSLERINKEVERTKEEPLVYAKHQDTTINICLGQIAHRNT